MNSRQIIKMLEEDGWRLVRVKGSHHQFKHPTKPGTTTVKHTQKDVPIKTVQNIEKQSCSTCDRKESRSPMGGVLL